MQFCNNDHVPIVHDERDCPLCRAMEDRAEAVSRINELDDEIVALKDDILAIKNK